MGSGTLGAAYQVFLSFRGPDTRQGFTDCLYHSLVDAGVRVFRDNEEIRPGEKIDEILRAIKSSVVCIPVFSKDYASSKWCLRELAEIVELKKRIMPVFYDVTPDDVKLKTSLYCEALARHAKENEKEKWEKVLMEVVEISGWESPEAKEEKALKDVVKIKGWEVKHTGHAELCKSIVKEVLANLKVKDRIVTGDLVEMPERTDDVLKCLDTCGHGVRYVGIYGMGGSGKTTLAKTVFNKISTSFEACCFLTDVRESSRRGLQYLQKKLICDLLDKFSGDISDTDDGIKVLRDICRSKKILIVLDDVDRREQIESLAGSSSWFCSGSRIIVTTRDISVLAKEEKLEEGHGKVIDSKEVWTLEMKEIDPQLALRLFSRYAFKMDHPPMDYLDLSKEVVSVIGHLPLTLEIIGSHLCGKPKEAWEERRSILAKIPRKNIRKMLMLSYEALDFWTKQIFLDIACLPVNLEKENAISMWRSCGFHPEIGIEELISTSMVKIVEIRTPWYDDVKKETFWMHDHLRDLGKEIVQMENHMDFGERSRVWDHKEALGILKRKEGTGKVEVMEVYADVRLHNCFTPEQLRNLRNLRLLRLQGMNIIGDFEHQLSKLRWLSWHDCPPNFTATNLNLEKLAVLDLSNSDLTASWEGWNQIKVGDSLAVLNLSFCKEMLRTPDFSQYKYLERLTLDFCEELRQIDSSIGNLKRLKHLSMQCCGRLQGLPEEIGCLERLEELFVTQFGSSSDHVFTPLPESIGYLKSLVILDMGGIKITRLPATIGMLGKLKRLSLRESRLERLPETLGDIQTLVELDLVGTNIVELPDSVGRLKKLEHLDLSRCEKIQQLPWSLGGLHSLSELDISHTGILELPDSIGNLEELRRLCMNDCRVRTLPKTVGTMKRLERLYARRTDLQGEIPAEIGRLSSLITLDLSETKICLLPSTLSQLSSLKNLWLEECNELKEIKSPPTSLIRLRLVSKVLKTIHLQNRSSLTYLVLDGVHTRLGLFDVLRRFPRFSEIEEHPGRTIIFPEGINTLTLCLSEWTSLPAWIFNVVTPLKSLILGCPDLQRMPLLPSTLSSLVLLYLHEGTEVPCLSYLQSLSYLMFVACSMGEDGFRRLGVGELAQLETLILKRVGSRLDGLRLPGSLQMLYLQNCPNIGKLPDLSHLKVLRVLSIMQCQALKELNLEGIKSLQELFVHQCGSLQSLGLHLPASLKVLLASSCARLGNLPYLSNLKNLKVLVIEECQQLLVIPGLEGLESLQKVSIKSCNNLLWLWPSYLYRDWDSLPGLKNLEDLAICRCNALMEITDLGELKSLKCLRVCSCGSLKEIEPPLPVSLEHLEICECTVLEKLPDFLQLKNLQALKIRMCPRAGDIPGFEELNMRRTPEERRLRENSGGFRRNDPLATLWEYNRLRDIES